MHINDLLLIAAANNASDLHLKARGVPVLRIDGELGPSTPVPLSQRDYKLRGGIGSKCRCRGVKRDA